MIMIYEYDDYRDVFSYLMKRNKAVGQKVTLSELAKRAHVQSPYLSKVFRGDAELNLDQAYSICDFFDLSEDEVDFVLKLVEVSRASSFKLKEKLKKDIAQQKKEAIKLDKNLLYETDDSLEEFRSEYYTDPIKQIVHLCLSLSKFQKDPQQICQAINISEEHLADTLLRLQKMRLIEIKNRSSIKVLKRTLHLSEDSPLCTPNQVLIRTKSLNKLMNRVDSEAFSFSATFSANDKMKNKIRRQFNDFIKNVQKEVKSSPAQDVYQINFDLFSWLS